VPSVSQKQHNLMAMVANNPAKAKQLGIPQSVGQEYMSADKGKKFVSSGGRPDRQKVNRPTTEHGKSALFKRGGEMKESKAMVKKEVGFMKKAGAPKSMIKHEMAEMKGMKSGGRAASKGEHAIQKQSKRGAEMVKMAKGGLAAGHKSADGIASRGKTEARQIAMKKGGKC